jgi:hypothetical protein
MSFSSATLGLNANSRRKGDIASDFNSKVDHILEKKMFGHWFEDFEIEYCGYNAVISIGGLQLLLHPRRTLLMPASS